MNKLTNKLIAYVFIIAIVFAASFALFQLNFINVYAEETNASTSVTIYDFDNRDQLLDTIDDISKLPGVDNNESPLIGYRYFDENGEEIFILDAQKNTSITKLFRKNARPLYVREVIFNNGDFNINEAIALGSYPIKAINGEYDYYEFNTNSNTINGDRRLDQKFYENKLYFEDSGDILPIDFVRIPIYRIKCNDVSGSNLINYDAHYYGEVIELQEPPILPNKKFNHWLDEVNNKTYKKAIDPKTIKSNITLKPVYDDTYVFELSSDSDISTVPNAQEFFNEFFANQLSIEEFESLKTAKKLRGYDIEYFYVNGDEQHEEFDKTYVKEGKVTIKAVLNKAEYIITYDLGNIDNPYEATQSLIKKYTVDTEIIDLTTISKIGYHLQSLKCNDVNIPLDVKMINLSELEELKDLKITVNFVPIDYLVILYDSDKTTVLASTRIYYDFTFDHIFEKPEYKFEKIGYNFVNWEDSKGKIYNNDTKMKTTGEIKLYAKYSPKIYKITQILGFEDKQNNIEVAYNTDYILTEPKRTGYTFKNWTDNEGEVFNAIGVWTIADNISIKANWTPNKYIISVMTSFQDSYTVDVEFDGNCNIYNDQLNSSKNYIIGYFDSKNRKFAGHDGQITKYDVPDNITLYPMDFIDVKLNNPIFNSIELNMLGMKTPKILIDGNELNIAGDKVEYERIGHHSLTLFENDNIVYEIEKFTIEADLGLKNNTIYSNPISLRKIQAQVYVDGILVEDLSKFRIVDHGKHEIVIKGDGGYEKKYIVEYKNNNIIYAIILTIVAFAFAVFVGVVIFSGRKNVINYDNNN